MAEPASFAAAQTVPVRGDVEANLAEHLRLADAAADEGARVVVYPELSLTGYELELGPELAFTLDDARLEPLRARAQARGVMLVVGAPVRVDARLHIGALALRPDGSTELYTKHHLGAFSPDANPGGPVPPPEDTVFVRGDRNPLLDCAGGPAACAVCADTSHPSHPAAAAARGAAAYLVGMYVIPAEAELIAERLPGYARTHGMTVVFANFGGPTGGQPSSGASAIWSQQGELIARLGDSGSGLVVARCDGDTWSGRGLAV